MNNRYPDAEQHLMLLPFVNPNDTDFPPDVVKHFESGMHGDELMIPWRDKV